LDREKEVALTQELMHVLMLEKKDGETARDFEERVKRSGLSVLRV